MKYDILPHCEKLHISHEQAFELAKTDRYDHSDVFTFAKKLEAQFTTENTEQIATKIPDQNTAEFARKNEKELLVNSVGNYLYSCEICGSKWKSKASLNSHKKVHKSDGKLPPKSTGKNARNYARKKTPKNPKK